jgi:hypothetical protein
VGCHSQCEKYLAFREYRDKLLEHKKKEQQLLTDLYVSSRHYKKKRRRPYYDGWGDR